MWTVIKPANNLRYTRISADVTTTKLEHVVHSVHFIKGKVEKEEEEEKEEEQEEEKEKEEVAEEEKEEESKKRNK